VGADNSGPTGLVKSAVRIFWRSALSSTSFPQHCGIRQRLRLLPAPLSTGHHRPTQDTISTSHGEASSPRRGRRCRFALAGAARSPATPAARGGGERAAL
jgi:hypothetical protein